MGKSNQTIRITLLGGGNEVEGNIVFLEDIRYDEKILNFLQIIKGSFIFLTIVRRLENLKY